MNPYDKCCCVKCGPPWRDTRPKPPDDAPWGELINWGSWMAVCPRCGNKRCAGANNHEDPCA